MSCVLRLSLHADSGAILRHFKRDTTLGTDGAVWLATQAIGNDAVRPSPAGQMSKLFADEP
jgi:hypothetical protein